MATRTHSTPPLLDIQSAAFAEQYEYGVWWSMHGEEQGNGPLSIGYLKTSLEAYSERRYFEQNDPYYRHHIGFYIGMYHGGVLSPHTGQLRPDVTALICFDHPQAARSYCIGREAFFHEPGPEYHYSEHTLIDCLQELVSEAPHWQDVEGTWNHGLGCLLGELSGFLFPETSEEYQVWQEECRKWETKQEQEASVGPRCVILQEA